MYLLQRRTKIEYIYIHFSLTYETKAIAYLYLFILYTFNLLNNIVWKINQLTETAS
jgi:hypothetical protein